MLIERYKHNTREMERRARKRTAERGWAWPLVHTLKGVAGNISANDLHAAALELEMAIKEEALDRRNMLLGNVEKALSQILESVRTLGDGAEGKVGDDLTSYEGETKEVSKIGPMLVKLAGLLKENDLEAEEYMESSRNI